MGEQRALASAVRILAVLQQQLPGCSQIHVICRKFRQSCSPLTWFHSDSRGLRRKVSAAFKTFCVFAPFGGPKPPDCNILALLEHRYTHFCYCGSISCILWLKLIMETLNFLELSNPSGEWGCIHLEILFKPGITNLLKSGEKLLKENNLHWTKESRNYQSIHSTVRCSVPVWIWGQIKGLGSHVVTVVLKMLTQLTNECVSDSYLNQEGSEDLTFHYWALFDGHAGSGAAVMASRLLHHHIALHLQEVMEILCTPNMLAPTCLGEEPINHHLTPTSQRALTRAASLRGAAGAPGSPSTPAPRFFTEKKVSHESLVIGAIENAFKDMVRYTCVTEVWRF